LYPEKPETFSDLKASPSTSARVTCPNAHLLDFLFLAKEPPNWLTPANAAQSHIAQIKKKKKEK
jgi:hypothetical protein